MSSAIYTWSAICAEAVQLRQGRQGPAASSACRCRTACADAAQIVRRGRNQVAFGHVDQPRSQLRRHAAGVADVSEGPFADVRSARRCKLFAFARRYAPPIVDHRP